MHPSLRTAFLCAVPTLATPAFATEGAIFSGLGQPGDGVTPSLMDELVAKGATAPSAGHIGNASAAGDFGYTVGIDLPPALCSPSLSVSYSSSSSGDGWIGGKSRGDRPHRASRMKSRFLSDEVL